MPDSPPLKQPSKRRPNESASDLDFAAAGESDGDDDSDGVGEVNLRELEPHQERSKESIATPPKGTAKSTPQKKLGSAKPKITSSKKSALSITSPSKIVKKQLGSAKPSTPVKVIEKASVKVSTSSNKTVGSKKLEDAKAQKHPEKKQIGATPAEPSKVKKGAPTTAKAHITAVKKSTPSTSAATKNNTLGNGKPKSLPAKPVEPRPASEQTKFKPIAATKTASAVKELVASKTAKVPKGLKTPASTASPSDSSSKSETFYSASSTPLDRSISSSSFDAIATSDCSREDGLLESALQIANQNGQNTDTTFQTSVPNSIAHCKKDPLNLAHLFSNPQTQSTHSVTPNSIPVDEQDRLEPMKMDLDNDPGPMDHQSIRMDSNNVVQSLQFSLQTEMQNLASKIPPSNSAISANTATQLDAAHSK